MERKVVRFIIALGIYLLVWAMGYFLFLNIPNDLFDVSKAVFGIFLYASSVATGIISIIMMLTTKAYHFSVVSFLGLLFGTTVLGLIIYFWNHPGHLIHHEDYTTSDFVFIGAPIFIFIVEIAFIIFGKRKVG